MSEDQTIILPSSEEIVERLKQVLDDEYMAQKFYPLIAQYGGEQKVAMGVVMMLVLAIEDFMQSGYPAAMRGILYMDVPRFIDALIDDKEVAEEAKMHWQNILNMEKEN